MVRYDNSINDDNNEESSSGSSLTRRRFLAGAAAMATGPAVAAPSAGETGSETNRGATYGAAQISREGVHLLATRERSQQQQGNEIHFTTRVDAVEDLGCDPSGDAPVQTTLNQAAENGMVIVFPPGTYLVTGPITPGIDGTFGIVGAGYREATRPPKPSEQATVFDVQTDHPINVFNIGPVEQGWIGNFVIDQRKPAAHGGVQVISSGNVRVQDIRTIGAQTAIGTDDNPGFFTPQTRGAESLIVFRRCIARGGGIPGSKNIGGSPGFAIFGRKGPRGTIILKDCVIENMADNGIYGARTKATVNVFGGLYRNNDVTQVRVNGAARIDGVDIVIDEDHYTGLKSKSNAKERGPGWPAANGIRIETLARVASNTGTPITNCNIVAKSGVSETVVGALVDVWDSGGAVTLENCRITNHLPQARSILGQRPGSGRYPAAPKPWQMIVTNSIIQGPGAGQGGPAVNIRDRPRSLVKDTCLAYVGASRADIQGAGISGVSFGRCQTAGLAAPGNVGSSENISELALNISASSGERAGYYGRPQRNQGNWIAKIATSFMKIAMLGVLLLVALIGGFVSAMKKLL